MVTLMDPNDPQEERVFLALRRLQLPHLRDTLAAVLSEAAKEQWTYLEFLDQILRGEVDAKQGKRIRMGLQIAHFPCVRTIEGFDFSFQPSADERLIRELSTGNFLTVTDFGGQLDADMTRQNGHDLRPRATEGGGSWPKESRHGRREGTVPSVCRSRKRTICGSSMIPRRFGALLMIVSVRPLSFSR